VGHDQGLRTIFTLFSLQSWGKTGCCGQKQRATRSRASACAWTAPGGAAVREGKCGTGAWPTPRAMQTHACAGKPSPASPSPPPKPT
jgi:hypothetical protein